MFQQPLKECSAKIEGPPLCASVSGPSRIQTNDSSPLNPRALGSEGGLISDPILDFLPPPPPPNVWGGAPKLKESQHERLKHDPRTS